MNDLLRTLGEEYWEFRLKLSPTMALMLGDHRYDNLHENASLEAEDAAIAAFEDFAARAQAIDPSSLSADETISRDVLIFDATTSALDMGGRSAEIAVNHAIGIQSMLPITIPQLPITEPEHAEALLEKFKGIGQYFRDAATRLQQGVAKGRAPIDFHVRRTVEQLDGMLALPIENDPLLNNAYPRGLLGRGRRGLESPPHVGRRERYPPGLQGLPRCHCQRSTPDRPTGCQAGDMLARRWRPAV